MGEFSKINPGPFVEFLTSVCPPLLGATKDEFSRQFANLEMSNKIRHFVGDEDTGLFISREAVESADAAAASAQAAAAAQPGAPPAQGGGAAAQEREYVISVESEPTPGRNANVLGILKRNPAAFRQAYEEGPANNFVPQLQLLSLGAMDVECSPFEVVNCYLQGSLVPLFNACNKAEKGVDEVGDESKVGIPNVQRKIADLSMALMQCQQNVEIEDVTLLIDPEIIEAFEKAKAENRQPTVDDFRHRVGEQSFLSKLQGGVSKWSKDIQRVAKLSREFTSGTTTQEINFWLGMEKALADLARQLKAPQVELTMELLKNARRFLATMSFESDTGLKAAMEKVANYLNLLRDFPINDLLVATTIEQLTQGVRSIFAHMKKIRNAAQYPLWRAYNLVEAVSRDLMTQLLKILSTQRLMQLDSETFEHTMHSCSDLFRVWDDEHRSFKELVREQQKKRGNTNERPPLKINLEHAGLQERINELQRFRKQHMKLQEVIEKVLADGQESGAKAEVIAAYRLIEEVDVLDVTRRGQSAWENIKKRYDECIDHAESAITARLRDRLGAAKTATEMFRVFSRFNALFVRPRIQGAIKEYQASLIQQVKEDVGRLQDKFKESYESTEACKMTTLRDIPPTAGKVIWAKQLERRLQVYMGRVEDVLGKGWEQHVDGKKLKEEGDAFAKKLRKKVSLFEQWLEDTKKLNFDIGMRIFDIQQSCGRHMLLVNYEEQIITLFKEVRNLQALQFRVPYTVKVISDEAKQNYPFAMTLQEAARTYMQTCSQIVGRPIAPMMVSAQHSVQKLIEDGLGLKWDSERIEAYTGKLSEQVFNFQQKFTDLESMSEQVYRVIESLGETDVKQDPKALVQLGDKFEKMQKTIDDMNLASFSNMEMWVEKLNESVEQWLLRILQRLITEWVRQFKKWPHHGMTDSLIQHNTEHELRMQSNKLFVEPGTDFAMMTWIREFHDCLGVVCNLPRLQAGRFDNLQHRDSRSLTSYRNLLALIEPKVFQEAYGAIAAMVRDMENYVDSWLQYQALWEISTLEVLNRLGDDLEKWHNMLAEIKTFSVFFDSSEQEKHFGPMVVDYHHVQSKVKTKYDQWHLDLVREFGQKVQEGMSSFYRTVHQGRDALEQADAGSADLTSTCMAVLKVKGNVPNWTRQLENLQKAQKLLDRQRYQFPKDWIAIEQVEGEWGAFRQILDRKDRILEKELPKLKSTLMEKEKQADENMTMLYAEWSAQKPVQGTMKPSSAMELIKMFEERLRKLTTEFDQLFTVKRSLNMEVGNSEVLAPLQEEMGNLRNVWSEINTVYAKVETLKETLWNAVKPKQIRAQLEDFLTSLKNMPPKLRQYEAFDHIQAELNGFIKLNMLVADLKTDALKERHWKQITQALKITASFNEMTLGHMWDANLEKHQDVIKEVLSRAQGEMGLEEFLREVRERWTGYDLELVPYKSKCRLIRGWDDLFAQLDEHLQSVQSMKMSPFYKSFEEEGAVWDDRLNKVRIIFDSWMDVQRRWVYLEGIFCSSADIQQLLPNEFNRFRTIDTEFIGLMKKVAAKPKVLEVVGIEGVQKQLDRLSDMLSAVQKALGDYLEKQRSQFARFYFVGDEDLLEMIGNSRDVGTVSRHLGKMFAGIAMLEVQPDTDVLKAMLSREGESVNFVTPIKISDDPAINAWLSKTEASMQASLGEHLSNAMKELGEVFTKDGQVSENPMMAWVSQYPCQVLLMAILADWCQKMEEVLGKGGGSELEKIGPRCVAQLTFMAAKVIQDVAADARKKLAQMITEVVHQRDVSRQLLKDGVKSPRDFQWLQLMRMYWNPNEDNILQRLTIKMADANFFYGFEYLGIADKLVQTPLTDRCFLTLTQALHMRLGANPFGPAGTGKTESVKALGNTMGRFVLVFCCDEGFDFQAMGRIFVGLCQVGAWGCFDEFNRLEERILSAVSEQVLTIQTGNKQNKKEIEILGKQVRLNSNVGIFVTMNPGYAGRSNLPDNLKQLFRAMAMTTPDKALIAQVNLYNQGFASAERLAGKVVFLFDLCKDQLSSQPHYDFGLRSLKAVLACAGTMKREEVVAIGMEKLAAMSEEQVATSEQGILLRSIFDTLVPKLVAADKPLILSLITGVFPGADISPVHNEILQNEIRRLCNLRHLDCTENFMLKCMELYQIQKITHGVMLVGAVATGKSSVWRILLDAMEKVDSVKGDAYVVDPKAISKEELYGKLDTTTLEWTDGVFTDILRRVTTGLRGEKERRQWIMFDGDVDPEWAENLNSVLDDNKLLTLPNGERLAIPPNVRIMFEVDTLKYATLATVSRCGMVWFADDVITPVMMCRRELKAIKLGNLEDTKQSKAAEKASFDGGSSSAPSSTKAQCVDALEDCFEEGGVVLRALERAKAMEHVMVFTDIRALTSLFSMVRKGINLIIEYNELHEDFPLPQEIMEKFIRKYLLFSICWSFGGDMHLNLRMEYCGMLGNSVGNIPMPDGLGGDTTLLDFEVRIEDGEWYHWRERVPVLDIEPNKVGDASLIISTVDTVRHTATLAAWLEERRPFVLSGPPGSGKTMTLMSTMKSMAGSLELASLNFSAGTTPELLLKTFDLYCETVKTPNGYVMRPLQMGKWVVVFCDECNLPEEDKYGTQRVIMFIRQITEAGGFYRPSDRQWVTVERVQFLGACNPPTDTGRHPMSDRFLRHAPVIWVDYPGPDSLKQIYGTFNRGMLKLQPHIPKTFSDAMTNVMVHFWRFNSKRFTSDMQPHYLYSPRELSRWKTALYEVLQRVEGMTETGLIRLCIFQALRIFVDRLVHTEEREESEEELDQSVQTEFGVGSDVVQRPILFSNYLSEQHLTVEVEREALREFVQKKLQVFYEEEVAVHLVIFDEVLDHIIRMDRVLRQPLGHLLLVGASGAGKTILSKFVSWMNELSVFTLKVGRNYDVTAFEIDLRMVMKRSGIKGEKITFIFDESNALGPAFLERMNALLASGEVPGLFEGDEYTNLMGECRSSGMQGLDDAELFARFTKQVQRNLHIVFTMNPANPDFYNRSNSSPALFNRCVIDWFGDWPHEALIQVAADFTKDTEILPEAFVSQKGLEDDKLRHDRLAETIVSLHMKVDDVNTQLRKSAQKYNYITPRDFLDFINHFIKILSEKAAEVNEQHAHIDGGLRKLKETESQVAELQKGLAIKEKELTQKNKEAEEKMSQMVKGQGEAEEKKAKSLQLSGELAESSKVIEEKTAVIQKEIAEVEPALNAAKEAMQGLNKSALDELRNLKSPPDGVKIAMEAAVTMVKPDIGTVNWDTVRKVSKEANFISNILEFEAESLKDKTREYVKKNYLDHKNWDYTAINKASRCAGPVCLWVQSQMKHANLLHVMEPMRNELKTMQAKAEDNKQKYEAEQAQVTKMEEMIAQYKEEYAVLIQSVQQIKVEMESVKDKCSRSLKLLQDLHGEKVRWEASSQGFAEQTATLIGDVLLSGAFCTYIGFFDLFWRQQVMAAWHDIIDDASIRRKDDLSIIDYLSRASERLQWKENALPDDDLCYENAIIMQRFIRYPLMIDPSGQAVSFLTNEFKSKKLMKTNFTDPQFMKSLETSLRFGGSLLVMDVDKVDPILNNVLNKETFKQGPRVLISLGDQDIDFSPSFQMYMCTRDSTAQFTPDLCSRVTFVNFTVTPSSLQSQCMNALLKSERPDVDKKRADMLKLQGEFKVKIRELEDGLLHALSNVQGSILEDVKVISTLEKIKKESSEIQEQIAKTDEVMHEIEQSSALYDPPGTIAASLFFLLQDMGKMNPMYRYSLAFFLNIFAESLKSEGVQGVKEYDKRLEIIVETLFNLVYQKIAPGLQEADVLVFGLRLAQVKADQQDQLVPAELDLLLKGASTDVTKSSAANLAESCKGVLRGKLNQQQTKALQDLHLLPCFQGLVGDIKASEGEWVKFLEHLEPEGVIPSGWRSGDDKAVEHNRVLQEALLLKALRPDRLIFVCQRLVETILGKGFLALNEFKLAEIVEKDSKASSPIMMVSAPGFDPSGKVTDLAQSMGKPLTSAAMGSEEGYSIADKAIVASAKAGNWVLLKNVHLAIKWLAELEKKLYGMNPAEKFRLFLTLEFNPRIPANLTRLSRVYVFEPPSGVQASLHRSFTQTLVADRTDKQPVERCRLHFLLAFLHATVLERLRYFPVGWSKKYEFSDADQACGRDIIDAWVDSVTNSGQLSNISPDKIPWDAIQSILGEAIYGGRIDNEFDHSTLKAFIKHLFCEEAFNSDFVLNIGQAADQQLKSPDGRKRDQFLSWIDSLPAKGSPTWIGLPVHAEQMLRINRANHTLSRWLQLQASGSAVPKSEKAAAGAKKRLSVSNPLASLGAKVKQMRENLPEGLAMMPRTDAALKDPLWRCFDREMGFAAELLAKIRSDLERLLGACEGKVRATNEIRSLIQDLTTDSVPKGWKKYACANITATEWLADFAKRLEQLKELSSCSSLQRYTLWFGGLFFPEAFLTASRQAIAQKKQLSLEELLLTVDVGCSTLDEESFVVKGVYVEGAAWDGAAAGGGQLTMTDELAVPMPETRLRWVHRDSDDYKKQAELLRVPVYLNSMRSLLISAFNLRSPKEIPFAVWLQRSVCLTLWTKH